MQKLWLSPYYRRVDSSGRKVMIDVTTSVSPGLPPNKLIEEQVVPLLKARRVRTVLDVGAGSLRHTLVLLKYGFKVTAVEFDEMFTRPSCQKAIRKATERSLSFRLIKPSDFLLDSQTYDAAILTYVLQVMPVPRERGILLKHLVRRLSGSAYLFYMSRYGQLEGTLADHRLYDGYVKGLKFSHQSFYTEFQTSETHAMMEKYKLRRLRSLAERGTDQAFMYGKGHAVWL